MVFPLAEDPSRELRIRGVVRPAKPHAALFDRPGLCLSERLRLAPELAAM